jgi:drug/metabolite transporter (DMT)-like permease
LTGRQAGLLGLLAALWGASYLFIKYGLDDFSPAWVVFIRAALAAVVLLAVLVAQGGETRRALAEFRRHPGTALLLGLLYIAAPFLLISYGEQEVPTGLAAILVAPSPLFVAAFAPLIDRSEGIQRRQAAGLLTGMVGVAVLVGVDTVSSPAEFLAALGILGAAACYALAAFVVKIAYRGVPAVTSSAISIGAGAVLVAPLAALTLPSHWPGLRSLLSLLALGVLGTALAFVIFYRLIAEVGAGRATLVTYLVPPLSLSYGALLLDERITLAAIVGLALILLGVGLAARRPAGPPEPAEAS